MVKQLLNSVIAKYHDLSVSHRATNKSQYFAQPRPIIVEYIFFSTENNSSPENAEDNNNKM